MAKIKTQKVFVRSVYYVLLVLLALSTAFAESYTKNSFPAERDSVINCDAGDARISCRDTGINGRNHGCVEEGADGCKAIGRNTDLFDAMFGRLGCEITCERGGAVDCQNTALTIDGDSSAAACACTPGAQWNPTGRCCGDDADDCGKISSGSLCVTEPSSAWVSASSAAGDIKYAGCKNTEYLSDGSAWQACERNFWKKTVGNSEYTCVGSGKGSISECCGDSACKSRSDGKRLKTGQFVEIDYVPMTPEFLAWREQNYPTIGTQNRAVREIYTHETGRGAIIGDPRNDPSSPPIYERIPDYEPPWITNGSKIPSEEMPQDRVHGTHPQDIVNMETYPKIKTPSGNIIGYAVYDSFAGITGHQVSGQIQVVDDITNGEYISGKPNDPICAQLGTGWAPTTAADGLLCKHTTIIVPGRSINQRVIQDVRFQVGSCLDNGPWDEQILRSDGACG